MLSLVMSATLSPVTLLLGPVDIESRKRASEWLSSRIPAVLAG
jgi:hypothetical protein